MGHTESNEQDRVCSCCRSSKLVAAGEAAVVVCANCDMTRLWPNIARKPR